MKKITLLAAIVTFSSFAFAQSKLPASNQMEMKGLLSQYNNPKTSGKQIIHSPMASAKKVIGDTLFYEDFTNGFPTGWTFLDNNGNNYDWVISNAATITATYTNTSGIASTSGGNYMLLFGDSYNAAQPFVDMDAYFQTDAIDLTGFPSVEVEFQQKFRYCCGGSDRLSFYVSNDNANWTEFDTKGGLGANDQSVDPDVVTIDISCIAGNKSTVYLRWHQQDASHYYWMVDDIVIREASISHELAIEENFYLDPWFAPPYTMIPLNHIDTSIYAAVIKNNRPGVETGVTLNVTVNDGANDVFNETSAPTTINGCLDSTYIGLTNGFVIGNIGTYTVNFELGMDSTDVDLTNNSVSHSIEVTDTVFARDNSAPVFELNASSYGVTQPYEFGVWYDLVNADTATSISVHLGPATVVGTVIQGKVYDTDLATVLETTGFHTVAIGEPGNWVTMKLNAPLAFGALSAALVNVAEFSGNDTAMTIQATNAISQQYATSWLFYGGSNQTPIVEIPFIRLNVSSPNPLCNLTTTQPNISNISCNGGSDGAISGIVPSNGTGPYGYLWTPGGFGVADITGLTPGVYTLTITDSLGCMYTVAADVTEPDPLNVVPVVTDISCNGANDGSVVGAAIGGDLTGAPAVVHFSEDFQTVTTPALPNGFTTATLGTDAGFYTGNAIDANIAGYWPVPTHGTFAMTNDDNCNCDKSADYLTLPVIDFTGLSGVELNFSAYDDGLYGQAPTDVEVSVNGGLWSVIYSMTAASVWQNISVALPTSTNNQASVQLRFHYNDNTGWATGFAVDDIVVQTPAVASAYQYSFSGGAFSTTNSFPGLAGGAYTITVKDAKGCLDSTSVSIVEPAAMGTTFSFTTANCGVGGSATISVTGGSTPYGYLWDDANAQTTSIATGLLAGFYTVTVTDSNGCMVVFSDSVLGTPPLSLDTAKLDPSACGLPDGWAAVTVLTGTAPYNFAWDDPGLQNTDTAVGLVAGIYNVTVTDIKFCVSYATVVLSDPGAPIVQISDSTQVNCFGGSDGTATTFTFGGTGTMTYSWNTSPAQTNAQAIGLAAGTYSVTVTDGANCSGVISTTITEPSTSVSIDSVSVTNVSCNGGTDGAANLASSGGTGAHSYVWSNAQTTQNATGLGAGSYSVVITDANGCTATDSSSTITEPVALVASAVGTNVTCNGDADGIVDLTVSGGVTPYAFLWSPGGETTEDLSGQGAGAYSVVVTDANGCNSNAVKTLTEPNAISVSTSSVTNVTTNGGSDGAVVVATPSGGTGSYTYSWIGPAFTSASANISNLSAGNYVLTVTDANGCSAPALTVSITEPPVGIGEVDVNVVFSIYPNPNTGEFMIELNNLAKEDYVIDVRNIIGQLVLTENISKTSGNYFKQVNLENKERGVYFVSLTNNGGTITKKLVIY